MYVHLRVAAPQEFTSFPFFWVDIRTAQTLRLERYITPVYTCPKQRRTGGSTRRLSNRRLFALLIQRNRSGWSLRIPLLNPHVLPTWIISSLAAESVWLTFWFPRGGGPSVDPSVRPLGSPFARRGAEPHHHHHQRSRCLCLCSCSQDPCALLSHHHEFGY